MKPDYSPIIAWCRGRISQLRDEPETMSKQARLDELSMVVRICQGMEVTMDLLHKAMEGKDQDASLDALLKNFKPGGGK